MEEFRSHYPRTMPSLSNAPDRPVLPSSPPDKDSPTFADFPPSSKSAFHSASMPTRRNWFDTEDDDDDEDSLKTILTGAQTLSLFNDFAGAGERGQDGSPTKKLFEMMLAEERISVLEEGSEKPEGEKTSQENNN